MKINKTIDSSTKCTASNIQTWLSTALNNVQTCKRGFIDLGATDNFLSLMSNNVTEHISNLVYLNKG